MNPNSARGLSRRELLGSIVATAGITGLGGCLSLSQPGASDVMVYNAATQPKSLSITITASETDQPHTSRSITVAPGEQTDPVNQSKLPLNSNYTIEVAVENGPSETFQWEDPTVERAPLFVFIDGTRNIKFLLQAG